MIDFDVIIIGTGSGNTILTPEFDLQIAIVEKAHSVVLALIELHSFENARLCC